MGGCLFVGPSVGPSVGDKILMCTRPACKPATPAASGRLRRKKIYDINFFSSESLDVALSKSSVGGTAGGLSNTKFPPFVRL